MFTHYISYQMFPAAGAPLATIVYKINEQNAQRSGDSRSIAVVLYVFLWLAFIIGLLLLSCHSAVLVHDCPLISAVIAEHAEYVFE